MSDDFSPETRRSALWSGDSRKIANGRATEVYLEKIGEKEIPQLDHIEAVHQDLQEPQVHQVQAEQVVQVELQVQVVLVVHLVQAVHQVHQVHLVAQVHQEQVVLQEHLVHLVHLEIGRAHV